MTTEYDLDRAQEALEKVFVAAQNKVAGLITASGLPFYNDPEIQSDQVARCVAPLRVAVEAAHAVAAQAEAEAKELDISCHPDPWALMTTEDLQRAEVLRPRIADFVEAAHGAELAQRLAWIALNGKPLEKLLYLELASRRTDVIEQTRLGLEKLIDPKQAAAAAKAAEKAEGMRKKASALAVGASQRLAQLDGSQARSDAMRLRAAGGRM